MVLSMAKGFKIYTQYFASWPWDLSAQSYMLWDFLACTVCHGTFQHEVIVMFCDVYIYLKVKIGHRNCKQIHSVAIPKPCDDYANSKGNQPI